MVKDAGLPGILSISWTVFFIFVERHQLFENLEKEPNLVEDAGMPGSSVISWTIIVQKHQSGLIWVSFKFNQQTTIIKEKKTDWT